MNEWKNLKKDVKAELNEELLEQFHGTVSLSFKAGENTLCRSEDCR